MADAKDLPNPHVDPLIAAARSGRAAARRDLRAIASASELASGGASPRSIQSLIVEYLRSLESVWPSLPNVDEAPTVTVRRAASLAVLITARRVVEAIVEGQERAGQLSARQEAATRRRLIDDLLSGGVSDPMVLAERAERFGILLSGGHSAAVAELTVPPSDEEVAVVRIEAALVERFGSRNVLVTERDGLLVCVTPTAMRGVVGELTRQLVRILGSDSSWRVGLGRRHTGIGGVAQSYEEARNALHVAKRLGLRAPVLDAADLLVFPVLLRDRGAITDLILSVLGPLTNARGGPQVLLDTLSSFFDNQGNLTATARWLGISVRTVTYRLERVTRLTGYAPTEPTQRFTLEAAVLGAKLLDWPAQSLSD